MSNKRDSCKLKSLAPLHNPSLPIISDSTTQKERKLNSQLFLLNAEGGHAVLVLGTAACRTEISSVRTVLLGGVLENRPEFRSQASIRLKAGSSWPYTAQSGSFGVVLLQQCHADPS